jgi:hypothetical protein
MPRWGGALRNFTTTTSLFLFSINSFILVVDTEMKTLLYFVMARPLGLSSSVLCKSAMTLEEHELNWYWLVSRSFQHPELI